MNEEWLSAHLDGELSAPEVAQVDAMLATDPGLAAAYADLARVRSVLRAAAVEPPVGSIERIVALVEADVEADEEADGGEHAIAPVLPFVTRRRVPTFAAVAAVVVIIVSVVGGIAPSRSLPALGDLIVQHQAAAAVLNGEPMPDDMDQLGMDEIPMDEVSGVGPPTPDGYAMRHAFANDTTVQLVYVTAAGDAVSVFRYEGDTDLNDLGAGSISRSGDEPMWAAQRSDAYVVVVDGEGYVWVVVSAEPQDSMMVDLMHDLPTRSPSLGERLRETADIVLEPFRFWG
jgi:hypothetical protein